MTIDTRLYAWARPLDIDKWVDHTWVTDYTPASTYPNIAAVVAADKNYWFCWGTFHDDNYRDIGDDGADSAVAKCLVKPNDAAAHGTIARYAIDGVCHQLANQVLYSTQAKMVVRQANGYGISQFLYGTYGRQHAAWANRVGICISAESGTVDDFEKQLMQTLGDSASPEKVEALLEIQADFRAAMDDMGQRLYVDNPAEGAGAINTHITSLMTRAHTILGDEGFKTVFGTEMRAMFGLVDPEMFAASEAEFAKSLNTQSDE